MAWASRRVSTAQAAPQLGASSTSATSSARSPPRSLLFASKQYTFGNGAVGQTASRSATAKTNLGFVQAIALGMLCNALVCLAVWLTLQRAHDDRQDPRDHPADHGVRRRRLRAPIANMYFIPIGAVHQDGRRASVVAASIRMPDLSSLTWANFFADNLLPVTIGNIIGGAVMVGAVYWFVYLRPRPLSDPA